MLFLLISDSSGVSLQFTNRCLLKWLKLWDTVVFGRERKSRPARPDRQAPNQNSFKPHQNNQNQNRFKTKIEMTEEILEAELDQYKRPKFKVEHLQTHNGTVSLQWSTDVLKDLIFHLL